MSTVTLYGRAGCHLCEDAMVVIERVRSEHRFTLEVIDIESDERLLMRYLERIPVVAVNGEERFDYFVDEAELVELVANLTRPES